MTSRDESIPTLHVVGETLEEDTGCELEDETGQDAGDGRRDEENQHTFVMHCCFPS